MQPKTASSVLSYVNLFFTSTFQICHWALPMPTQAARRTNKTFRSSTRATTGQTDGQTNRTIKWEKHKMCAGEKNVYKQFISLLSNTFFGTTLFFYSLFSVLFHYYFSVISSIFWTFVPCICSSVFLRDNVVKCFMLSVCVSSLFFYLLCLFMPRQENK